MKRELMKKITETHHLKIWALRPVNYLLKTVKGDLLVLSKESR